MEQLVRTNFFISTAERQGLTHAARRQGVSAAALLRRVLDSYLGIAKETPAPITFKSKLPPR